MLKIIFDKNAGQPVVMAGRELHEIINDLTAAVGGIYHYLKAADEQAAEFFKVACSLCFDVSEGAAWSREYKSAEIVLKSQRHKDG